jgi:hypothetical protein
MTSQTGLSTQYQQRKTHRLLKDINKSNVIVREVAGRDGLKVLILSLRS